MSKKNIFEEFALRKDDDGKIYLKSSEDGKLNFDIFKQCAKTEIFNKITAHINSLESVHEIYTAYKKYLENDVDSLLLEIKNVEAAGEQVTQRTVIPFSAPHIFTGGSENPKLSSEIKKELSTCCELYMLVSFIRWSGIQTLYDELKKFTDAGGILKIITTVYTGATEFKAISKLTELKNTTIKISYDIKQTRLHAKSYIFKRDNMISTVYIGSSNISRVALESGTEWNVKFSEKLLPSMYTKVLDTFEGYWNSNEYEEYHVETDADKLRKALEQSSSIKKNPYECQPTFSFRIQPYPFQERILDALKFRRANGNKKNVIICATGTGKTIISAFDFLQFYKQNNAIKFIFICQQERILEQAQFAYRNIVDSNFGKIYSGSQKPTDFTQIFATVQTLKNDPKLISKLATEYEYIVIDEAHHIGAESWYKEILNSIKSNNNCQLLCMTATPERADGVDICKFFDTVAAQIRLPDAIKQGLLCPFQYFMLSDNTDLSNITLNKNKFVQTELTKALNTDARATIILKKIQEKLVEFDSIKSIGFCCSKEHAIFMSNFFNKSNVPSNYITSDISQEARENIIASLKDGKIKFIFAVDIFNEGVDIPEINTLLFLRPTESLTIFIQQLGRGLRLHHSKDCLTVLDFVSNYNKSYDIISRKIKSIADSEKYCSDKLFLSDVKLENLVMPLSCDLVFDEVAKDIVIKNIENRINKNRTKIEYLSSLQSENETYENFFVNNELSPSDLYAQGVSYSSFKYKKDKNKMNNFNDEHSELIKKMFEWSRFDSSNNINDIIDLFTKINETKGAKLELTNCQELLLKLVYYSDRKNYIKDEFLWENKFQNIESAIYHTICNNENFEEILQLLKYCKKYNFGFSEENICPDIPLSLYGRYSKKQIMNAFGVKEATQVLQASIKSDEKFNTTLIFTDVNKSNDNWQNVFNSNEKFIWHFSNDNSHLTRKETEKFLLCVKNSRTDDKFFVLGYVNRKINAAAKTIEWSFANSDNTPHTIPSYVYDYLKTV